jgi:hypothetical protein
MKGIGSVIITLYVMARLDPRFREDAIQPAQACPLNESYDRLDGPLLRAMTNVANSYHHPGKGGKSRDATIHVALKAASC